MSEEKKKKSNTGQNNAGLGPISRREFAIGSMAIIGVGGTACTTAVTSPAIYNAIGKWIDDFPTTSDKVLKALWKI